MSAFTVVRPTVSKTAIDVPLKVVLWKGADAMLMLSGPNPVPLMIKMAPCAIGPLGPNARLLAAFAMAVMVGAAARCGTAAKTRRPKRAERAGTRLFAHIVFIPVTPRRVSIMVAISLLG